MTKAAMTSISGASLRRLVRPLLSVATIAAIGIAVAPAAHAAATPDQAATHGFVAKGPDGKADGKDKVAVFHAQPAASPVADGTDKKKDESDPK